MVRGEKNRPYYPAAEIPLSRMCGSMCSPKILGRTNARHDIVELHVSCEELEAGDKYYIEMTVTVHDSYFAEAGRKYR
jgi:hypothetical protein